MNARQTIAAAVITLTLTAATHANDNFDRNFNINFGNNGFNVNFGGNGRNVFRQAERVLRSERNFRREVNDLPFNQRIVLLRLSNQVNQRTEQLIFALRNDNRRQVEVRASQLAQTVNQIEFIVDQLPRNREDARDVRRAFDNLEDDVRDLLRNVR
jgi:hypothetical protein